MFLMLRYRLLRSLAWCLRLTWAVPPRDVVEAVGDGVPVRITYELILTHPAPQPDGLLSDEEINGTYHP